MLASYAKGVEAMLKLPADHPQNWFRNAFTHLMDCPHGNWWFYVWHRGYLGFFERSIRALSGDETFAMPYWDWTQLPQIPDGMFDGVLTPTDGAYEPFTGNLAKFTAFIKTPLTIYWNSLSPAQRGQLGVRGYKEFDALWNDVTGYNPDPSIQAGAATFKGTRILVHQIADLIAQGATEAELREDYPRLTREMIAAAAVYAKSHPRRGRPRKPVWQRNEPHH